MATNYVVGQKYTPTNFVRTGAAPGTTYADATWGISASNPGTLKSTKVINGVEYGDFQFASGSGWAPLNQLQFASPAAPAKPSTVAATANTNTATALKSPSAANQVAPFLDSIQKTIKTMQTDLTASTKTDAQIMADIKKYTTPSTAAPTAPKLVDLFGELRDQYGVGDLEGAVTEYDDMIEAEMQYLDTQRFTEEGKPVAMGVIAGRVGEQERNAQLRIDFLGRQKTRAVNQLNSAYGVISTMITLTGQDFENATTAYNTEFNQKLELYKVLSSKQEAQADRKLDLQKFGVETAFKGAGLALDIYEAEQKAIQREQDTARANIEMYANLLKNGNVSFDKLDPNTKLAIQKMEIQSGLGAGFLSSIRQDNPNGEVVSTTTRQDSSGTKYADIIMRMPDGSIQVQSKVLGKELLPEYAGGGGGGGSNISTSQRSQFVDSAQKILQQEDIKGRSMQLSEAYKSDLSDPEYIQKLAAIQKNGDDKILSKAEMTSARDRIIGLVGNTEVGKEIFQQAMEAGGYSPWTDDPEWSK